MDPTSLDIVLDAARQRAIEIDLTGDWPEADLDALAAVGASRWVIPRDLSGDGLSPLELYLRYERIAAASLTLALIQSQRDSAVALIDSADRFGLRPAVLSALRDNAVFTTVGIAQLTTSRQGGKPALRAQRANGGWRVDGVIPWATGAGKSDFLVAGAAAEDGNQILFLLPTGKALSDASSANSFQIAPLAASQTDDADFSTAGTATSPLCDAASGAIPQASRVAGIHIDPPLPLVALRASWTGQVRCDGVHITDALVLRGPDPKVLGSRRNTLPLGQAFLAMGLCKGGLNLIAGHRSHSAAKAFERLGQQLSALRQRIVDLSAPGSESQAAAASPMLRGECNDLAIRITHAAVALYKGTALLDTHPAQRLAREAMFLLVWSCPDPVIDCTVDVLSGSC